MQPEREEGHPTPSMSKLGPWVGLLEGDWSTRPFCFIATEQAMKSHPSSWFWREREISLNAELEETSASGRDEGRRQIVASRLAGRRHRHPPQALLCAFRRDINWWLGSKRRPFLYKKGQKLQLSDWMAATQFSFHWNAAEIFPTLALASDSVRKLQNKEFEGTQII